MVWSILFVTPVARSDLGEWRGAERPLRCQLQLRVILGHLPQDSAENAIDGGLIGEREQSSFGQVALDAKHHFV